MFSKILANFTLFDLLTAGIVVWACRAGFRQGVFVEIFKLIGLFAAAFTALHFYSRMGALAVNIFGSGVRPLSSVVSYALLVVASIGVFRILRDSVLVFFNLDDLAKVVYYTGAVVGFFRGLFLAAVIFSGCLLSNVPVIQDSARDAFAGRFLAGAGPGVYTAIFRTLVNPVFPSEEINDRVRVLALQTKPERLTEPKKLNELEKLKEPEKLKKPREPDQHLEGMR